MEYTIVFESVPNPLSRDVEAAAEKLRNQVNHLISGGWEPLGGIATGSAGTSPYLFQAMTKR